MKKLSIRFFITCAIVALLVFPFFRGNNVVAQVDVPVLNPGFETSSGGQPSGWTSAQWDTGNPSVFQSTTDQFHAGTASAKIVSNTPNDSRWSQTIAVEQNSWYLFDGWIKTSGVTGGSIGAHFDVVVGSTYPQLSNDLKGTNDWTEERIMFNSGSNTTTILEARLGFFGSTVSGTAFFDDVSIKKFTPPAGRHVSLVFFPETYQYLNNANAWLAELDDAYEAHQDLVGQTPYGGDVIGFKEVPYYPGGALVSGNPVLWEDIYIPNDLKAVGAHNDLSFGPVHELGHDFDFGNPIDTSQYYIGTGGSPINAEQWANLKVTHAADVLSSKYPMATLYQGSVGYVPIGQFSQKYFVEKFADQWISSGRTDWANMNGDTYTGLLYKVTQQIGWEPFKKTFRDFIPKTLAMPSTDLGKVELFVNLLSKNSGYDLTPEFRQWGFPIQLTMQVIPQTCSSWSYSNWGTCSVSGIQSRTVLSSSPLGCTGGTPVLTQSCTYTPPACSSWTYSNWSVCSVNGTQTRSVVSSSPSGCVGGSPLVSQNCTYTLPACSAGYTYSDWSVCFANGTQTRSLVSTPTGCTMSSTPITTRGCTYMPPFCSSWSYSSWSTCSANGQQTRNVLSSSPSGCVGGSPAVSQSCTPPQSVNNQKTVFGCPAVRVPVCGTDTITYTNECEALRANASIEHEGECMHPQPIVRHPAELQKPEVVFVVYPDMVLKGKSATLRWESNGEQCQASGEWGGKKRNTGQEVVYPKKSQASYYLTCFSHDGTPSSRVRVDAAVIKRIPKSPSLKVLLKASSVNPTAGTTVVLSWDVPGAMNCEARGDWSGLLYSKGRRSVTPKNRSTYQLICWNRSGERKSTSVTVTPVQ